MQKLATISPGMSMVILQEHAILMTNCMYITFCNEACTKLIKQHTSFQKLINAIVRYELINTKHD